VSGVVELLDPSILSVGDVDDAVRIDRDASGASELAIPAVPGENEEPASA